MFAPPGRDSRAQDLKQLGSVLRCGASVMALCAFVAATPALAQTAQGTGQATGAPGTGTQQNQPENADLDNTAGQAQDSDAREAPETRISDATEAPQDEAGEAGEIIVTGIRQSLANAQNIKRRADTVVDAITAEDIGALPDRSVTEALQRVPGVAINRFAGSNDPDHFSVEGSGVVIRGLNFVRSEFNGRDTFSANAGRVLSFADVPAELVGSVEVYKNVTAEMIEGGLAGTINLNTRLPFDKRGFHVGFSAEANYSDFIKEVTPTASLLVSNTFDTGIGTFGVLGSVAYSQVKSRADGIQVTNFQTRDDAIVIQAFNFPNRVVRNRLPTDNDGNGDGLADLRPLSFAPIGATRRTQEFDRERAGYAGALQWESNDRTMLATLQFLRSEARQSWNERTFEIGGDLSEYNTYPVGCLQNEADPRTTLDGNPRGGGNRTRAVCPVATAGFMATPARPGPFRNYEYDEDGVFERGFITLPGTGWRMAGSGSADTKLPTGGSQFNNTRREVLQDTMTQDIGFNFKWNPNEQWAFNFDAQYVDSTTENLDFSITSSILADTELDLTGEIPQAVVHKPQTTRAEWAAPNPRLEGQTDAQYFNDPSRYFWRNAMDHIEDSEGEEIAFKADVAYNFEDRIPGLRRLKFGARYADRDQSVRSTAYNWGVLSEVWSGNATAVFLDEPPNLALEQHQFRNFFRGQTVAPPPSFYYGRNIIQGYFGATQDFLAVNQEWNRRRNNNTRPTGGGSGWVPLAARPGVIEGTPFLPGEITTVSEETKGGYAMLSFGSDDPVFGDVRIDGNIGVRYVHTEAVSLGSITLPQPGSVGGGRTFAEFCAPRQPPAGSPPGTPAPQLPQICLNGPEAFARAQAFANGANFESAAENKFDHWLPSLNVKIGVGPDVIVRLAASKVLTRPNIGQTQNFLRIGANANGTFQATASNPFILPATAKTFDAGIEWYFARVGSLTLNGFYKDISNIFFVDVTERSVTNNGQTFPITVTGPANFRGGGEVKGFEAAYQQTYEFLPGPLSGLGINANYTYVKSKGIPNSIITDPQQPDVGGRGNLPLEQLSKHNANFTLFYEKYGFSARASYSWRSKFLLTARDVIFPFFPIYNDDTGTLDASVFYSLTDQLKIGLQGVNLNNEITKTIQVFSADGREGPRSYFMNDRRISFVVRGNF
jgi:TonB-dependent receptor